MNLSDFEKTSHVGLYLSKVIHPSFGRKYIARFQHNKKRYVKVLGYSKKNNLTQHSAIAMFQKFKDSVIDKEEAVSEKLQIQKEKFDTIDTGSKQNEKQVAKISQLKDHIKYLEELLGDYKSVDKSTLKAGVQKIYDLEEIKDYQIELIKLQTYLEVSNKKMIILFEGRDASGKGGAIRRITRYMNNKHYRIVALGKPNDTQRNQWFFQRYIEHFPTGGEVVLFDRSWYNRAMVEPIFGFCTDEEHEIFMEDVVNFEHDLVRQNMILVKLYFSVSKDEQKKRFANRTNNPLKQWKFSEVDMQAQDLWEDFSEKKYEMLKRTSSRSAPWHVIRSDEKHKARLEAIKIILNSIDYDGRNYAMNFEPNEKINISVQKELSHMRKNKDY